MAKYGVKEIIRMGKIYRYRFRRNKNGKIADKETPNKGDEFVKIKRIMARLDAQLNKEKLERKKGGKKNG